MTKHDLFITNFIAYLLNRFHASLCPFLQFHLLSKINVVVFPTLCHAQNLGSHIYPSPFTKRQIINKFRSNMLIKCKGQICKPKSCARKRTRNTASLISLMSFSMEINTWYCTIVGKLAKNLYMSFWGPKIRNIFVKKCKKVSKNEKFP